MEKKAILFVDDEPNILSALRRELRELSLETGLEIRTAPNAVQALKDLTTTHEDTAVIVSDLKMPEMKGSDFLLQVRELYPEIVTILLTGFSEPEEIMKAVKAGIHSYILKPWEPAYLRSEIEKAMELFNLKEREKAYQARIADELRWAGEMQRTLLKPNLPRSEGIEFRVSYRPVRELYCGGDYYDVIYLGKDRYLLLLGDVAGHGVRAAFVTGILKAVIYSEYIRPRLGADLSPSDFLSWLNERIHFELRSASDLVVTFFAGVLDRQAGAFKYSNAGQTHPFLIRGGTIADLPVSGTALGFAQKVSYPEQELPLLPGDVLLLYTDGLVEIGRTIGKHSNVDLAALLGEIPYGADYHRRLLESSLKAAEHADFDDDVTILTARLV